MLEQPSQFVDRAVSEGIPSGDDRTVSGGMGGRHGDLISGSLCD
jgi:hypothetical protein